MIEEFRSITGFPDYEVSNFGRIRNIKTGKFLRGSIKKTGYIEINLKRGKESRYLLLHRLVAEAFCERFGADGEVNHKDGEKSNNNAENLEWVTHGENLHHAFSNGLRRDDVTPRAVIGVKIENGDTIRFPSIYKAARALKISQGNICMACKGERPYAGGYVWRYSQ